jgi:hypothetical protein
MTFARIGPPILIKLGKPKRDDDLVRTTGEAWNAER